MDRTATAIVVRDYSLTARPFFERHGFTVIAAQDVPVAGEVLRNFRMERAL